MRNNNHGSELYIIEGESVIDAFGKYQRDTITLTKYIKFLVSLFKEGGVKVWASFILMQLFRIVCMTLIIGYFTNLSSDISTIYATVATIMIWPFEVLLCWRTSVKRKRYFFGQLTGRP